MNYHPNTVYFMPPTPAHFYSAADTGSLGQTALATQTAFLEKSYDLSDLFDFSIGAHALTTAPSEEVTRMNQPTPTVSESVEISTAPVKSEPLASTGSIEDIAKQRVQILAAKYARDTEQTELMARLEILNQRLLNHSPRVSKTQISALENISQMLDRAKIAREERSSRFGIPA